MESCTRIVDDSQVLNEYEYDAWGNVVNQKETIKNRFKFNGQQLDPITQQYYLRARFYNPVIARFTQEDTYRGDGLNLYAYCGNNPVKYVDPTGNVCDENKLNNARVGDFTNLKDATLDEILDRIPDEAVLRELTPVEGGSTQGFEFKWNKDGQTYRLRVHNEDLSAPINSNAANGWTLRIQRGRQYYDYTIENFQEAKFTNPKGEFFDEVIMNNTHIPIKNP